MRPVLDGPSWHIGTLPDLGELNTEKQEVVDHAIFQAANGKWQLWACVRRTAIGRLLYRWEGDSLTEGPWEPRGIAMRAENEYGESIDDWDGEEWIQAPYVHFENGRYFMFYGGHRSENGHCQICLATSTDGIRFAKRRNENGYSRIFVGPGETRDPMVIKVGDRYLCYYTGNEIGPNECSRVYCRQSSDMLTWSEPTVVHWGGKPGLTLWSTECPFVIHLRGYYYLFHTRAYYPPAKSHVYRSMDPLDFGPGGDSKLITTLRVAAPEILFHNGEYFISNVEDLRGGVQLTRLRWVEDEQA
jgi:hypothetical protein